MIIECAFNKSTGDILGLWMNDRLPVAGVDGWKPFLVPVDPQTDEPALKADGTIDAAKLPPDWALAKIDLDYPTLLAIQENGGAGKGGPWVCENLKVDTGSLQAAPKGNARVYQARLVSQ